MKLSIRKGTTKTLLLSIDQCCKNSAGRYWEDLGTVYFRLKQGNLIFDKTLVPLENDPTTATVSFTQDETIQLIEGAPFQWQLFSILNSGGNEIADKSDVFDGTVLPSLWSEVIHNGQ